MDNENFEMGKTIKTRLQSTLLTEIKESVARPITPYKNVSDFIRAAVIILLRAERKVNHIKDEGEYLKRRSKVITLGE